MTTSPVVRVQVFDRLNTTPVADLVIPRTDVPGDVWHSVRKLSVAIERAGNGTGSVTVRRDHPNLSALAMRRFVRVSEVTDPETEATALRGSFSIDRLVDTIVGSGDEAVQGVEVTGAGPLSRLGDGIVLPWVSGLDKPQSYTRVFNGVSPGAPLDEFTATVYELARTSLLWGGNRPVAYLDPYAAWIWPEPDATTMPAAEAMFVRDFYLSAPALFVIYGSFDDGGSWWLDGCELLRQEYDLDDLSNWHWTWKAPVRLPAGWHRFGIIARNAASTGPAGVIASGWTATEDGGIDDLVFVTGSPDVEPVGTWHCAYGYSQRPGWTAGRILTTLLDEQEARGCDPITRTWNNDEDSVGYPWAPIPEWSYNVPAPTAGALDSLRDSWCDFGADLAGLTAHAYDKSGPGPGDTGPDLTGSAAVGLLTRTVEL